MENSVQSGQLAHFKAPHSVTFVKELPTIAALVNSDSSELLNSFILTPQDRQDQKYILRADRVLSRRSEDYGRQQRINELLDTDTSAYFRAVINEPDNDSIDVLLKVSTEPDTHPVDARLNLAAKERLTGMLRPAILTHLRHRPMYLLIARINSEILQLNENVRCGCPRLQFVPGPFYVREQRASRPLAIFLFVTAQTFEGGGLLEGGFDAVISAFQNFIFQLLAVPTGSSA